MTGPILQFWWMECLVIAVRDADLAYPSRDCSEWRNWMWRRQVREFKARTQP